MTDKPPYEILQKRLEALEKENLRLRQADQALKENEERYRVLSENVVAGVTLIQDGHFIFVNNTFVSMFGLKDSSEVIGKDADRLFSKIFKRGGINFFGPFQSNTAGKEFTRMASFLNNNQEKWVQGYHTLINYKGKPAVFSIIRDITERRLREIESQVETAFLREENLSLKSSLKERFRFGDIVGMSRKMQEVYKMIIQAANSNANVAIYGESGTGKELVAKAIHNLSSRSNDEFVTVNCGAIPGELLESEFFGYKKGAFTGAYADKDGYLGLADRGTLFLDEVGELSQNMQIKLLRVLDGTGYSPVGSNKTKNSDFRIISATNQDLKNLVKNNQMREDFFYRIHVIPITIPPLRERVEDLPLLIDHFLKHYNEKGDVTHLPGNVMDKLYHYHWPGNIRELKNVIQRYLTVKKLDFMEPIHITSTDDYVYDEKIRLNDMVEKSEHKMIIQALNRTKWNRTKAAQLLGISRKALYRKLKKYEPKEHNTGDNALK